MLLTTTPSVEGRPVTRYCGIVSSIVTYSSIFLEFSSAKTYKQALIEAKEKALTEISQKAERCGANAVVGIKFDCEIVGAFGSMLMVVASGTAVVI